MEYHRHAPVPPLDRLVDHCWLVGADALPFPRQVLFPDGGVTMHFNLADPPGLVDSPSGRVRRFATSWISGERTRPYTLDLAGRVRSVGIRFRPGGVYPFVGVPARELAGQVIELEDVLGPLAGETLERLGPGDDPARVFAEIDALLLARLTRSGTHDIPMQVAGGLEALDRAGPSASVIELARDLGVSHRTLLRLFDRWVGVTPKTIQRVLRFQKVIAWENAQSRLDWSEVAYGCGYYDQAHLIRDFRAFTGTTPTRYRAARLAYPNYVPASG